MKATVCTESNALATEFCPHSNHKEAVFLNKVEQGVTDDTPYILPNSNVTHTGIYYEDEPPYAPPYDDLMTNTKMKQTILILDISVIL